MKRIIVRPNLCMGCKNCQFACMVEHSEEKSPYFLDLTDRGNQPRNSVLAGAGDNPTPLTCRHCQDAPCVQACPSGAMYRDPGTGLVLHDAERCAGCWMCVMSCPYGLVAPDAAGRVVVKCDFCQGSEQPQCVVNCPTGALSLEEEEEKSDHKDTIRTTATKTRYLIIGASAAGLSCAATIREHDPSGLITVLSGDRQIYSRCLLADLIDGERTPESISFVDDDFFQKREIEILYGKRVAALKPDQKQVLLENGNFLSYDKLLIATGATPVIPRVEGLAQGKQVYPLRSLDDVKAILDAVGSGTRVVVMGGGLVGLETAEALERSGSIVSVIERLGHLLPLQLDDYAAAQYEKLFRAHGVNVVTGRTITRVRLDRRDYVLGVELDDQGYLPCSVIIVAAGVRPATSFLADTGIVIRKGITVDQRMRTSLPDIYAAGDVCESADLLTGRITLTPIWPAAVLQGHIAGLNMTGVEAKLPGTFAQQNAMSFFGLPTISFGWPDHHGEDYAIETEVSPGGYKKVIYRDGRLIGAIFQGDLTDAGTFGALLSRKIDISNYRGRLLESNYTSFLTPEGIVGD